jgi:hypothetical protein
MRIARIEQFFPRVRTRLVKITTDSGLVGWGETTLEGKPKSTIAAALTSRSRCSEDQPHAVYFAKQRGVPARHGACGHRAASGDVGAPHIGTVAIRGGRAFGWPQLEQRRILRHFHLEQRTPQATVRAGKGLIFQRM